MKRAQHPEVFRFAIQNDEKYEPKQLAQQILQAAYQTGYGKLLDLSTAKSGKC
jgi:hypothetical protein